MTRAAYRDESLLVVEGDVIEALGKLRAESVQTCVTSPPYWGLRDYGTAKWEGGNLPDCDHQSGRFMRGGLSAKQASNSGSRGDEARTVCNKCGARRIDAQLGLEATPDEYVRNMVNVFREVRRVLREDGTLWLNLGDSYASGGQGDTKSGFNARYFDKDYALGKQGDPAGLVKRERPANLKPKDLVGIPWRVAFALQADGWYLRSDIIWHKPNPMPESVTDRPTKAHEYIFLMAKSARYFFDLQAIREPAVTAAGTAGTWKGNRDMGLPGGGTRFAKPNLGGSKDGFRQKRDVWTIATQPFKGAHFATFPPDLIEPCILAGAPEGGTVLDPFAGSGTTLMVARQHNRRAIGIELNPEYIPLILDRCGISARPDITQSAISA